MYNEDDNSSSFSQQENDISSDDEMDWEQVDVLEATHQAQAGDATTIPSTSQIVNEAPSKPLEITLDNDQGNEPKALKRRVMSHAERVLRLQVHKIHTICLISNGRTRNRYLNDDLLHARLMSLVPLPLQSAFTNIHKKREPDVRQRGRMFENAMKRLTNWWHESFFKADPQGSGEIQSRTFDEVQRELNRRSKRSMQGEALSEDEGEVIRSCKSLQKHVLLREGSRDVSTQLFTALCRALDIPARLIVSIQSVPWKASLGKYPVKAVKMESPQPQTDRKGKAKAVFPGVGQTLNGRTPEVEEKVSSVKLRTRRSQGKTLRQSQKTSNPASQDSPPTQWTEVFSRADGRWFPIDPIRGYFNDKRKFEPQKHDKRNRMAYVLAFEEDGYVRDVTQRYAHEFNTKTSKLRLGGRGKKEWWDLVMSLLSRPYRLHRDDLEDAELQHQQVIEGMPTSVAAFKDHPLYVLERHVLRDQIIHPQVEIGRFRGEPVFSRAHLLTGLKTSENWMRSGRVIKEGEQPLKTVKVRPVTINRKRALEVVADNAASTSVSEDTGGVTQGLYAEFQTELYTPPPVVNGKVPKNDFGNIDLYVDTMLPRGAVHVPFKGAAKIAKELGFDYAEAVTGFEFKNRRAFPILTGIVIAAENESAFLEAYWEVTKDAEERERLKKENRLLKQWAKLINGLRVRKRLQEQYADDGSKNANEVDDKEATGEHETGGFLIEMADNVVQAYTLPKQAYPVAPPNNDTIPNEEVESQNQSSSSSVLPEVVINEEDVASETIMATETEQPVHPITVIPKTLQEIAEANPEAFQLVEESSIPAVQPVTPAKPLQGRNPPRKAKQTPKSSAKSTHRRKRPRRESSSSEAQESDNEDSDAPPRSRRKRTTASATPSARVLRPRKLKSEDILRQEREKENAIESALLD